MRKFFLKVAALYDSKREDLNKYLGYDGIIHHHNGILPGRSGTRTVPKDQERLKRILHGAETALSLLAIRKLSLRPGAEVLDAGCGRGGNSVLMASGFREIRIKAVNISGYQIGEMKRIIAAKNLFSKIRVFKMSMEALSFKKGAFDRVLACESTEHVDLDPFFSSLSRVSKKNARLVIVAWTANSSSTAAKACISAVNEKYVTELHSEREYLEAGARNGWVLKEKLDLTRRTFLYWKFRSLSRRATGTERLMAGGFGRRYMGYMLYAYEFVG